MTTEPVAPTDSWSNEYFINESWSTPLVVTSAVNIAAIIIFEIATIARVVNKRSSKRHFFLGQSLLAGLFLMSMAGLCFTLHPSDVSCILSQVLVGLSTAFVFGTLLVKCVFLMSLHSGVYLPASYQSLLLFFIILVQIVVTVQWTVTRPTEVVSLSEASATHWVCSSSYESYVLSLLYIMGLIGMVTMFSFKCRRAKENYREIAYIGYVLCIVIPLWISWILTGFAMQQRFQPACLGFGMTSTALVVFIIMFIPKGRQLSSLGKSGLFNSDQESLTSVYSNGKYTPSFLMFQPFRPSLASKHLIRDEKNDKSTKGSISSSLSESHLYEGIYTTLHSNRNMKLLRSNPNVYLFKSHSNISMMY